MKVIKMNEESKKQVNKKKTLILITIFSFIGIMVMIYGYNGNATPDQSGSHAGCHGGAEVITITSPTDTNIQANPSSTVSITINMTGTNRVVIFVDTIPADINKLTITPGAAGSNRWGISDGDTGDDNGLDYQINVIFKITLPADVDQAYSLIITAGNGTGVAVKSLTFTIKVGAGTLPGPNIIGLIFDHAGIWLGLPALILITLGTILVLKNENKYVKTHGILAGGSFVLTTINVIVTVSLPWSSYPLSFHWPHIILGAVGLIAAFFSMLYGIAAERKNAKITGYIALFCWWGAFILGFIINPNMFVDFGTDFMSLFGG
jgi:NADH:ubiquinone oxidoreductase subunit 6 (subunit J)